MFSPAPLLFYNPTMGLKFSRRGIFGIFAGAAAAPAVAKAIIETAPAVPAVPVAPIAPLAILVPFDEHVQLYGRLRGVAARQVRDPSKSDSAYSLSWPADLDALRIGGEMLALRSGSLFDGALLLELWG